MIFPSLLKQLPQQPPSQNPLLVAGNLLAYCWVLLRQILVEVEIPSSSSSLDTPHTFAEQSAVGYNFLPHAAFPVLPIAHKEQDHPTSDGREHSIPEHSLPERSDRHPR